MENFNSPCGGRKVISDLRKVLMPRCAKSTKFTESATVKQTYWICDYNTE